MEIIKINKTLPEITEDAVEIPGLDTIKNKFPCFSSTLTNPPEKLAWMIPNNWLSQVLLMHLRILILP